MRCKTGHYEWGKGRALTAAVLATTCWLYNGSARAGCAEALGGARAGGSVVGTYAALDAPPPTALSEVATTRLTAAEPLGGAGVAAVQVGGWLLWAIVLLTALLRRRT